MKLFYGICFKFHAKMLKFWAKFLKKGVPFWFFMLAGKRAYKHAMKTHDILEERFPNALDRHPEIVVMYERMRKYDRVFGE